jgi:hypothetical protein
MKKPHSTKSLLIATLLTLTGCASENKSVGIGAAIGALGGAAIGGIADPGKHGEYRTRNVVVGATLGTMMGAVSGSLFHKHLNEERAKAFESGKKSPPSLSDGTPPKLSDPKIEARFIEGRPQGNRFVGPHWEYILVEPARWTEGQ